MLLLNSQFVIVLKCLLTDGAELTQSSAPEIEGQMWYNMIYSTLYVSVLICGIPF